MKALLTEQQRITLAYDIARLTTTALAESLLDLEGTYPFKVEWLTKLSLRDRLPLDAFVKRFENVIEAGKRLFRAALVEARENQRGLSNTEASRVMEKLELIDSASQWLALVEVRNTAAHEYTTEPSEAVEALNEAYEAAGEANRIVRSLLNRLGERFPPPRSDARR